MVLVLQLDDVYRGSILGFATQKMLAVKRIALVPPNHRVNRVFCVAGFRPGRRGPFVPAKGPKTIDAPCLASLVRMDANLGRADQLASLKQGPPTDESVPPLSQTAGVGPWETNISVTHMKNSGTIYFV